MKNIYGHSRIPGCGTRYILLSSGVVLHRGVKHLSSQITNSGYEIVHISVNGKRKALTMHRLVALAFVPNPDNKPFVNHKDGDKTNNDANNLEWVTHKENMAHAYLTGLNDHKGSKNSRSKLKEEDVPVIRRRISNGEMNKDIASDYGVDPSVISCIRHGKIWTHVPEKQLEML